MTTVDHLVDALRVLAEQQSALQQLVATMAQASTNAMSMSNGGGKSRMWEDIQYYKNVKLFNGDVKEWEEFVGKLKGQVAAGNPKVAEAMDHVEQMAESELENEENVDSGGLGMTEAEMVENGHKMYNLLLNITTGEANAVVRRCRGRNGWLAWKRICAALNPRTLASGVKAISQVLNPPKITDAKKADFAIEVWEDKMAKLSVEYGESLTNKVKVAVLYGMLPKDLQEKVLDKCAVSWDSAKEDDAATILGKIKEEVKNVAKSRREMVTPKPMEVDWIQAKGRWCDAWDEEDPDGEEPELQEENEINYVGNYVLGKGVKGKGKGKCWTCGEAGHRAAECTKGGGKGKSNDGYGKGGGYKGDMYGYKGDWYGKDNFKGGYQAKGYGWNGKGKGELGKGGGSTMRACFGCGSTDHILRDCPKQANKVNQVTEEQEQDEILFIGRVKEEWKETPMKVVPSMGPCSPKVWKRCRCSNSFQVLQEDEEEEQLSSVAHIRTVQSGQEERMEYGNGHGKKSTKAEYHGSHSDKKKKTEWVSLGVGEIIVDSAADESCWPKGHGDAFVTKPSRRRIELKTANGGSMEHYGEKDVTFRNGLDGEVVGLRFQVTDVKKPLLAVRRLVERGNIVSFGAEPSQNYILHIESGRRIAMEKKGGSFVIKAEFVMDPESGFIRPVL